MQKNRLKELRDLSKLTLEEVAKIIEIAPSTIYRHETGERSLSLQSIEKYAKLYKVTTYELFNEPVDTEQDLLTAAS